MDSDTRDLITWTLGTALSLAALVGLGVRFILMPYLREHLVKPMALVQKQVTENSHHNAVPTVLDRIDDVRQEVATLNETLEDHMAYSEADRADLWRAVAGRGRRWPWSPPPVRNQSAERPVTARGDQ